MAWGVIALAALRLVAATVTSVWADDDRPSTWSVQLGGVRNISDLSRNSGGPQWAVGSGVFSPSGNGWRDTRGEVDPMGLLAVGVSAGGHGWAVGDETAVESADGRWAEAVTLRGVELRDVAVGPDGVWWAVGRSKGTGNGIVLRYSLGKWQTDTDDFTKPLNALWLGPDGTGWAVGEGGIVAKKPSTKSQWSLVGNVPTKDKLHAIVPSGQGDNDFWVVGGRSPDPSGLGGYGVLARYHGGEWAAVSGMGTSALADAVSTDRGLLSVAQDGAVFSITSLEDVRKILSLPERVYSPYVAISGGEAAGTYVFARKDGAVFEWGAASTKVGPVGRRGNITGITAPHDSTHGWAASTSGSLQHDKNQWSFLPDNHVLAQARGFVKESDSKRVWAYGNGGLLADWNGTEWSRIESDIEGDILHGAVGPDGANWVLAVEHGGQWRHRLYKIAKSTELVAERHSTSRVDLRAVSIVGQSVFLAGQAGVFAHRGDRLTPVSGSGPVYGAASLSGHMWLGVPGGVMQFNGGCWRRWQPLPRNVGVWGILPVETDDVWAVASSGYVMHFNGDVWNVLRGPSSPLGAGGVPSELYALDVAPDGRMFVAGSEMSILGASKAEVLNGPEVPVPTDVAPPIGGLKKLLPPEPMCPEGLVRLYLPSAGRIRSLGWAGGGSTRWSQSQRP
jgi:hypothetical protein